MLVSARLGRRTFAGVLGGGAVAATLLGSSPSALADPPNCTAADRAQVIAGVSSGTAGYLFAHPDVNAFFSGLAGQPRDAIRTQVRSYLDANPGVRNDLGGIRQPLIDMRNRCGPFVAGSAGPPPPPPPGAPPPPPPAPM